MRLSFPERLWKVGQSEGDVLAHIFQTLAGSEDPAAQVMSPRFPDPVEPLPTVPQWAREELENGVAQEETLVGCDHRITALMAQLRGEDGWTLPIWGAALHWAAFEATTSQQFGLEEMRALFRRRGQILIEEQRLTVIQPIEAIDLNVRRTALDSDPGWLPWLERSLYFEFVDPDAMS